MQQGDRLRPLGEHESSICRVARIVTIIQIDLYAGLYRVRSVALGRRFPRLTHSIHLPSDHSSSPSPSTTPVLMLPMSFISFSLIGIGAQASGPWVQITMP